MISLSIIEILFAIICLVPASVLVGIAIGINYQDKRSRPLIDDLLNRNRRYLALLKLRIVKDGE